MLTNNLSLFTLTQQTSAPNRLNRNSLNINSLKTKSSHQITAIQSHKKDKLTMSATLGGNSNSKKDINQPLVGSTSSKYHFNSMASRHSISKPVVGAAQGPFSWMTAPTPPLLAAPSILGHPLNLRPAGSVVMPPQITSYNNTYGGIAEV